MREVTLIRHPHKAGATFPRGEGKGLVFFVVLKTDTHQYVFGYKENATMPHSCLPLGGRCRPPIAA